MRPTKSTVIYTVANFWNCRLSHTCSYQRHHLQYLWRTVWEKVQITYSPTLLLLQSAWSSWLSSLWPFLLSSLDINLLTKPTSDHTYFLEMISYNFYGFLLAFSLYMSHVNLCIGQNEIHFNAIFSLSNCVEKSYYILPMICNCTETAKSNLWSQI